MKFVTKPTAHETDDRTHTTQIELGQLFAAMPADRQEQIDREALINRIRKLEFHLQNRNQEPQIEEQQQRLEKIVSEIVPELLKYRLFFPGLRLCLVVKGDFGGDDGVFNGDAFPFLEILELVILAQALAKAPRLTVTSRSSFSSATTISDLARSIDLIFP